MYKLPSVDEAFLRTGNPSDWNWRFVVEAEVQAAAEPIFAVFEDENSWPRWFKTITGVQWTSPEPKTVGTTRTVKLGNVSIDEYFFAWETNKRIAFRFDKVNFPAWMIFAAGAEDYVLEPLPNKNTKFTYTVVIKPTITLHVVNFFLCGFLHRKLRMDFENAAMGLEAYFAYGAGKVH